VPDPGTDCAECTGTLPLIVRHTHIRLCKGQPLWYHIWTRTWLPHREQGVTHNACSGSRGVCYNRCGAEQAPRLFRIRQARCFGDALYLKGEQQNYFEQVPARSFGDQASYPGSTRKSHHQTTSVCSNSFETTFQIVSMHTVTILPSAGFFTAQPFCYTHVLEGLGSRPVSC